MARRKGPPAAPRRARLPQETRVTAPRPRTLSKGLSRGVYYMPYHEYGRCVIIAVDSRGEVLELRRALPQEEPRAHEFALEMLLEDADPQPRGTGEASAPHVCDGPVLHLVR